MKLLGLLYGKKDGNHEVLITEALTAAQEVGADVSTVRLIDLDIKSCTACMACAFSWFGQPWVAAGELRFFHRNY
jgi:multimeric flavodoxin WrbA